MIEADQAHGGRGVVRLARPLGARLRSRGGRPGRLPRPPAVRRRGAPAGVQREHVAPASAPRPAGSTRRRRTRLTTDPGDRALGLPGPGSPARNGPLGPSTGSRRPGLPCRIRPPLPTDHRLPETEAGHDDGTDSHDPPHPTQRRRDLPQRRPHRARRGHPRHRAVAGRRAKYVVTEAPQELIQPGRGVPGRRPRGRRGRGRPTAEPANGRHAGGVRPARSLIEDTSERLKRVDHGEGIHRRDHHGDPRHLLGR